ncbi:hypothetical protein ABZ508_02780 [Streptomyces lavendulocolor]|uniref:Uncharacterized protein n=1 Tax=Streptomyces lavendulocolor TaxID=67316 RepID=A0ABV2W0P1_9ACTN
MSAPMSHDPVTLTTSEGTRWIRAAVTRDGRGLYRPELAPNCPEFVMATLDELAEHGIKGQPLAAAVAELGALPLPVAGTLLALLGDAQPARDGLIRSLAEAIRDRREHNHEPREDWYCLNLTGYLGERMAPVLRRLLDVEAERDALRARVAELEAAAGDGSTRTVDEDPIAYALTDKAPLPADMTHMCGIPLTRRLDCGHCPHEVCQDCDRCPCSCCCAARSAGLHHDYRVPHDLPQVAAEMLADRYPSKGAS